MSERIFALRLPVEPYKKAIEAIKTGVNEFVGLDSKREYLGNYRWPHMREKLFCKEGENGLKRIHELEQDIKSQENAINEKCHSVVLRCCQEYERIAKEMLSIDAGQIKAIPDAFKMLELDLVDSENELQDLLIKNCENNAYVRACVKFAEGKQWNRTVILARESEKAILRMHNIFDELLKASENCGGYNAMLFAHESSFEAFLKNNDLLPEYEVFNLGLSHAGADQLESTSK